METLLKAEFSKKSNAEVRFSFGSSGALTRQIRAGAPFDAILSANIAYVRDLAADGKVDPSTVKVYARGRLGTWSKSGLGWADLTQKRVRHIAIANPVHAPYGLAAKQALVSRGLWEMLQPKLVYGENVRQAFQFAEAGSAEIAITAWTLIFDKGGRPIDPGWHQPIEQAAGVVSRSRRQDRARLFLQFLLSPAGQAILGANGLDPVQK